MAVVPVFIDADPVTRLQQLHLAEHDLIVIYLPGDCTQEQVERSVRSISNQIKTAGIEHVGLVITQGSGWRIEHLSEDELRNLGLRKI